MKLSAQLKACLLALFVSVVILHLFYGKALSHAGEVYFSRTEDAIKNYYTMQYHVLHDSDYWHFSGMAYPYGDHVVFTDNQPLLSNSLKFIHLHITPLTSETVTATANYLMLYGIAICALLLCLILTELGMAWLPAAVVAVIIAFLSPQIQRFTGHYALAYTFSVPALWYLWLRFYNSRKPLFYSLLYAVVAVLLSFLHLYNLALALFAGLALGLFYFLYRKPKITFLLLHVGIQVVLPLLIVKGWISVYDHIADRPTQPYGFLAYRSFWEGIFLPYGYPLGNWTSRNLLQIRRLDFENANYVGLVNTIFMVGLIFGFLFNLIRRKWRLLQPPVPDVLKISFWAAFCILLFSFGLPFLVMEFLIPYLGPLKQFRSIGRFAWIFFYIINVCVYFYLYQLQQRKNKLLWPRLLFYVALAFGGYEAYTVNNQVASAIEQEPHRKMPLPAVQVTQYQAIIPLPYFHVGSEAFTLSPVCMGGFEIAQELSLKYGLPLTASVMSRTSISQTMQNLAIVQEAYRPLSYVNGFSSQKPFLLQVKKNCTLTAGEQQLISLANFITEDEQAGYYSLSFSLLQDKGHNVYTAAADSIAKLTCAAESEFFIDSFEDTKASEAGYIGSGRLLEAFPRGTIYEGHWPQTSSDSFSISFWLKYDPRNYHGYSLELEEFQGGKHLQKKNSLVADAVKIFDGNWALVEKNFGRKSKTSTLKASIKNSSKKPVLIDEVLLRPAEKPVCRTGTNYIYLNNRFYTSKASL